jgi:PAS domain S-box-containing protein
MKSDSAHLLSRLSLTILLAGLPLSLVLFAYIWQSYNQVHVDRELEARYLVERLAAVERDFLLRNHHFLQDLAETAELRQSAEGGCSTFLDRMLSFNRDFTTISLVRADGELVCSADPMSGRINVADRAFFQRTLSSKTFVVGTAETDRLSNRMSLALALPILDQHQDRVSRVLFAVLSTERWSLRLGGTSLPSGARAVIVDANNTIIAHYPPNTRAIGLFADSFGYDTHAVSMDNQVTLQEFAADGVEPQLQAFKPLLLESEAAALVLGVSLPLVAHESLARQRLTQGLLLFVVSLVILIGAISFWLKKNVAKPLLQLLEFTQSADESPEKRLLTIGGLAEVKALQTRIGQMVDAHLSTKSDLQASEARFSLVAETIQEVFWVVTPDWKKVLYVNPAYEYVWQRSLESLYHQPLSWLASVMKEDRESVMDYIKLLEHNDFSNIVFPLYRIERRDGTLRWISAKGFPVYDDEGKLSSVVGIAEDVTERKQYEIELKQREAKYRLLVENAEDLVVKMDLEGHFLFVSPSYCRAFGKSEHQLLGKAFMPLVHEDDQAATVETMKALYYPPFKVYLEQRAMTIQGWRWFGWSDTAILDDQQHVCEIIGVGRDITRQKEAEFALRESESLHRELVDNMSDGVAVYQRIGESSDFIFTNFNHAAERISGYSREQVLGKRVDEIFPGVRELGLLDAFKDVAESGRPQRHPLASYQDDRMQLWVENYVFKLASGEVVTVFRDLTTEHLATEALRQSEKKFRGFFEELSVGLVIADQRGLVQVANKAFCQMFGVDQEVLTGTGVSLPELLSTEINVDTGQAAGLKELIDGRRERYRFQASYEVNSDRWLVANIALGALHDEREEQTLFYGIAEDVTALEQAQAESNRLQRELTRTYRLEALGRLAGGIAHDFNNILGAITGFVELAVSRLGEADDDTVRDYLKKSEQNSERAKQLISQLLIFSRGPEQQTAKPHDLNRLISDSMEMIRSLLPASITMNLQLAEQSFRVVCDPVQIEQVLLNLCINARDAMGGKGDLKLVLGGYHADYARCAICSKPVQGDWVSLYVQDSGEGISDVDMEHIFEPFFSTKGRQKGTGLGLSVVQGIVESYNGHILVERDLLRGTAFRVLFPVYDEETDRVADQAVPALPAQESQDTSGMRVLVVDDELSMRQLLDEALSSEGYNVTLCRDGAEAWALLEGGEQHFDLLITDQTMPHVTGLELVEKLRAQGDDLPVVLCTGYSDRVNEEVLQRLSIAQYLRKPLRLKQLSAYLHQLLAERRPVT